MSNQNIIIEPLTMEERKAHEAALSIRAAELQQDAEYLEYIRLRDERQREFMELMESEEEEDEEDSESEEDEEEEEEEEPLISNEELEEYQAQYNNIILGSPEHMEYMNQYGRQESDSESEEESDEESDEESEEDGEYEDAGSTPTGDK